MARTLLKIPILKFKYLFVGSLLYNHKNEKAFLVCSGLLTKTVQFFNKTKY